MSDPIKKAYVETNTSLPPSVLKEVCHKVLRSENEKIELFSLVILRGLHTFGSYLTMPFSCSVNLFQYAKLLPTGFVKAFLLTITPVFAIVGFFLSFPGGLIRGFASLCNMGKLGFSPSTAFNNLQLSNVVPKQLKIMTWNTGLGPGFISLENHLGLSENRVDAVVQKIIDEDADLVSLQEVFDKDATNELVKKLNERGYDCIHSILNDNLTKISSGLFVAVKRHSTLELSVSEIKVWQYSNSQASDNLSCKGLVGVKLQAKKGNEVQNLYLFNTHLQASYGKRGFGNVRMSQVEGVADKIQEWTKGEESVLCGDFNFGAIPIEEGDNLEEYRLQMLALERANLSDPNENAQLLQKGTFVNIQKDHQRLDSVVDYIFVNKDRKNVSQSNIVDMDLIPGHVPSDHFPVTYQLDMEH